MNTEALVPNAFYRVSIKGLILDQSRKKFAITREDNGLWELPGGGLDWGESPQECLVREVREEMGLTVTKVAQQPTYHLVGKNMKGFWCLYMVFEISVEHLNFTPSNECQDIQFISPDEVSTVNVFRTVQELAKQFDPQRHV